MNYYLKVLKNYATFTGRARRSEYWYFVLFNMIFAAVATVIDNILGTKFELSGGISLPYGYVYLIYALATIIPGLAVGVRRLHDIGKSGWMLLVVLIPLIGVIWILVLMVMDSNPGNNNHGPNPKEANAS
jgi:uncharacterized membrane protein YhaH (DUF805 family)